MMEKESKIVEDFVKWIGSEKTQRSYKSLLKRYFDFLGVEPDTYFKSKRDYEDDVRKFSVFIRDVYAPGTQKAILNIIKNFLADNDVSIKPRVWKQIKLNNHLEGDTEIIDEKIPDNSELKQILQHGTIKDRALFLVNATSGERINETLSLTINDIEDRHIIIQAKSAKKRYKRHTFITIEAREALDEWLKVRTKYIKEKIQKSAYVRRQLRQQGYTWKYFDKEYHLFKDEKEISFEEYANTDPRIFPFNYSTAVRMWNRLLESSGQPFNEKDDNPQLIYPHYKYHIHTLRKFAKTQMMSTQINKNHLDTIFGHKKGMDTKYGKFRSEQLQKSYEEYCDCLSVFSDMSLMDSKYKPKFKEHERQITTFNEQLKEKDKEIQELRERIQTKNIAQEIISNPALRSELAKLIKEEIDKKD
ncbi:MAG: site-specific integrase [Thermoplasmatales archaeon]|nr:MAG: site-specific integrase [Thermoplasmatales archaeon]